MSEKTRGDDTKNKFIRSQGMSLCSKIKAMSHNY